MDDLSPRQQKILRFIQQELMRKGYPPSVREIGEAVGLSSSSTVHAHLERLEQLGYIRRDPTKPRAIEVLTGDSPTLLPPVTAVPVVGRVTAGEPILAEQNIEEYFPLPKDFLRYEDVFILKIRGESMIEAGIFDGDLVLVKRDNNANNGDIVVALLGDEATVKRFYKEKNRFRLQPENSTMEPIYTDDCLVLGKVIGLIRRFH
ncbi:MAG TPA: transcriptional repressor LexA [Firmicutes bacterium]|jgi:repressor LexA|nr:transcriptional repressor LexA [Bacillota bacterium]HOQ24042.1 transcriptional repressor LexA [Bacillota bacterium]HPT67555.1 transcriptional repressor LexA [Bacillota bacterium]